MPRQEINFGQFDNDPAADTARAGATKIEQNFQELYTGVPHARLDLSAEGLSASWRDDGSGKLGWYVGAAGAADGAQAKAATVTQAGAITLLRGLTLGTGALHLPQNASDPGTKAAVWADADGAVVAGPIIRFFTGADAARAERVRISADGKFGVGATPAETFHVGGSMRIDGESIGYDLFSGSTKYGSLAGAAGGVALTSDGRSLTIGSVTEHDLVLETNGTARVTANKATGVAAFAASPTVPTPDLGDATGKVANMAALAAALGALSAPTVTLLSASGTWTKPAGMKAAIVIAIGPGGGGGGSASGGAGASCGGGAGGFALKRYNASDLNATEAYVIGMGGAPGTTGGGGASATVATTFKGLSAGPGTGGGASGGSGGAGGVATGGDINVDGGKGQPGDNLVGASGGQGGSTAFLGPGGGGAPNGFAAAPATGYGGGGGGGGSAAATTGGAGRNGAIIILAYF